MVDSTKAQQIANYNAAQQAKGAQANPGVPPTLVATPGMSTADIALIQKAADKNQTLTADEQIRLKALETKQNLAAAAAQNKQQQDAAAAQARKDAKLHQQVLLTSQDALKSAGAPFEPAANWFANLPTVGGLATIVILLVVFVMAIVPVNEDGDTRLKLVWLTITGKTHLKYQNTEASGDFGNTNSQQGYRVPVEQPVNMLTDNTGGVTPPPGINLFDLLGGSM